MRIRLFRSFALLCLSLSPVPSQAGDCRAQVRPLLMQADPAQDALTRVQALCAAEAEAGDAEAIYQLSFFSLGLGGSWQPATAIPLIQTAADAGIPEAQYWLAWQSEDGPELPHDPGVALGWYRKAAAGNHRLALQRLAVAFERGDLGLPVDHRKSLELRAKIRRCEEESARNRD